MKNIFIVLFVVLCSCKVEPEALRYGTDACHTCKMTLMDKKFGAELVTAKGKVYKFDDLNCMVSFIDSDYLSDETIGHTLVIDYSQPGKLIPAHGAFYLKSDDIRSPMASGIAAFEIREALEKYMTGWNGVELGWNEISSQGK